MLAVVLIQGVAKHVGGVTKVRDMQRNKKRVHVGFEGGQTPFHLRVPKREFVNM